MKRSMSLFLFLFCFTTFCFSQSDITGKWYGSADIGGVKLRLVFTLEQSGEGYSGTMLSPDQSSQEIPLSSVSYQEKELVIGITPIAFSYTGKLTESGKIEGSFTQSGQNFKLDLSREEVKGAERPQEPQPPYPYHSEDVIFSNDEANIKLAGTLTLPQTSGSFTAVVLVSGSGAQNRNEEILGHKPFLVLADYLTRQGIAVLRYDDRGVGESEGNYMLATLSDFATDAQAAINYLKSRKEINTKKIGIIGHSEGGGIAHMLAARQIPSFIITLAAPGVNGQELLNMQRKAIFTASGIPEVYINQYNDYMGQAQQLALKATDKEELRKSITQLFAGTPMENQTRAAVEQLSSPEIVSFLRYDPLAYFKNIKCPVLALNGMKDLQVPYKENLSAIQKNILANRNIHVITKAYPNLNHLFQTANTGLPNEYGTIEETLNEEVLKDIADWLLKR